MVKKDFGNRVTENDIPSWLGKNGFFGESAKLYDFELAS